MTPDEFPGAFARGWSLPKPDGFLGYFMPMIAEDAVFTQPLGPPAVGHRQIERLFRGLFGLLPDLTTVPHRSAVAGGTVLIESTCAGSVPGGRLSFRVSDRFELRNGLIVERSALFDPTPLLLAVLRHPSLWRPALRASGRRDRSRV
jgi:hypothetical protein